MRPGTSKPYNLQACEIPNSWASLETRPVANTERRLGTPSPERARLNPSCFFPSKPAAANLELCVPTVSKHAVVLHLRDPYDEVHSSQTYKVPQSRRLPREALYLLCTRQTCHHQQILEVVLKLPQTAPPEISLLTCLAHAASGSCRSGRSRRVCRRPFCHVTSGPIPSQSQSQTAEELLNMLRMWDHQS